MKKCIFCSTTFTGEDRFYAHYCQPMSGLISTRSHSDFLTDELSGSTEPIPEGTPVQIDPETGKLRPVPLGARPDFLDTESAALKQIRRYKISTVALFALNVGQIILLIIR